MLYWNKPEWGEIALKFASKLLRKPSASYHIGSAQLCNSDLSARCLKEGLFSVKGRTGEKEKKTFTYYQITNFICFWVSSKSNWLCESWSCILGSDTYHLTHDFSSSSLQNYCEQEDWKIFFFFFFPDHQRDCCFKTQ